MYKKSEELINDLAIRCAYRGFRLYRHSTGTQYKESKLLLMCNLYQTIRCPFIMDFRRPDLPQGKFVLIKYRIEHNHPIVPDFKAGDRFQVPALMRSRQLAGPGFVPKNQPFGQFLPTYNGYPSAHSSVSMKEREQAEAAIQA